MPVIGDCAKCAKATSLAVFIWTWGFCPSAASAPKPKKQQVPPFSCLLGAFRTSHRKNSFCYRIFEFIKSNKFPCFRGYLGLLPFPGDCVKTAKATSSLVFVATWGFCSPETSAPKPKKQQVPLFSCLLGAFHTSHRKNSFCYRIFKFIKSNKYPCFYGYLGLLTFRNVCSKT